MEIQSQIKCDLNEERNDRQIQLFGKEGQSNINKMNVAVVGVGGLGSHIVQQLAYLGIGHMNLIDIDHIEKSNLNRLIGAHWNDIESSIKKVDIAKRQINSINPNICTTSIPLDIRSRGAIAVIKRCNCVFGCVDNDGARLILNEVCSANNIPYIDCATEIFDSKTYGGRVFINIDGNGCLYCYGEISPEEAAKDLASAESRKDHEQIYGVPKQDLNGSGPAVVTLNAVVASLAATEFMVMVTGLRPPKRFLRYIGNMGIVTNNNDEPEINDCYYCKELRKTHEK